MNKKPKIIPWIKPKVGQTVFITQSRGDDFIMIVSKVGRKYFYGERSEGWPREIKFNISDWQEKTDYVPGYQAWQSREEIKAHRRRAFLRQSIKMELDDFLRGASLDDLEELWRVINE